MNITILTPDDQEKLELIERVFNSLTKEEISDFLSQDVVVGKLKGIPDRMGVLTSLVFDNSNQDMIMTNLQHEVLSLRGELMTMKSDMLILIKYMNEKFQGYSNQQSEFNSMKGRYGVY
jgi:hypothetical protein